MGEPGLRHSNEGAHLVWQRREDNMKLEEKEIEES